MFILNLSMFFLAMIYSHWSMTIAETQKNLKTFAELQMSHSTVYIYNTLFRERHIYTAPAVAVD